MEMIDLKNPQSWSLLEDGNTKLARKKCFVSEISPFQILVMGGYENCGQVSEDLVMIYDTKQATLSIVDAPTAIKMMCFTRPSLLADGSSIAIM